MKYLKLFRKEPMTLLLAALPLAILAEYAHWGVLWVFAFSALAVIPLAGFIGKATEALAHYTGPRFGALINATLGNAAELIITIAAIRLGLLELVKASITGSILGNLLLVLGMSVLLGGVRNGIQTFDRRHASSNAILLVLAVLILLIPSLLSHSIGPEGSTKVEVLSLGVAGVMILLYGSGLLFSFVDKHGVLAAEVADPGTPQPGWSIRMALFILFLATLGTVYFSELLVNSVEPVVASLGISEFFVGIIFIPIIGNVAEHIVAVQVAIRNKMSLSVEITVASSLQIALFVAPVLVFVSLLFGHPLTLIFNQFELLALVAGILIAALVSADGETNWLEGAELLAIYLVLGLAFFLL
ncbi:MAG: calcium/proton exchanger [Omnitrophica WOR_2 bacterium]